ncbi:MAG TPA: hypothetical protein VN894_17725 [Polyangiaceae bacterium]|nr:hypothetical protein [Polyangiaceae bacterium]
MKPIITRVAHAGHGDHQYFGHSALADLLGVETSTGLLALAITGRRPTTEEREVLDALCVSLTAADPRIWPLKLCRMVASYGEALAGFAAGQLAMMGHGMSPRIMSDAAAHLKRLRRQLDESLGPADVERILRDHVAASPRLAGYGIPMRAQDERFEALRGFMIRAGRSGLPHWRAQEALSECLRRDRRLAPNIGIGHAAALLDLGCSPAEAGALSTLLIEHTFAANAFEAAQQCEPLMQRLPDGCVQYVGPSRRASPRAAVSRP